MRVAQFHRHADVARAQLLDGAAFVPLKDEHLPQLLGKVAIGVPQLHAGAHAAAVEAEEGEVAHVGFADRLPDVAAGGWIL
jgi:hypothetical protein